MKRLALLALLLLLAPSAEAKQAVAAKVCGLDACVRTTDRSTLDGLILGGPLVRAPRAVRGYYTVKVIMGGDGIPRHWFMVDFDRDHELLRAGDGSWMQAPYDFLRVVDRVLPEGRPFRGPDLPAIEPPPPAPVEAQIDGVYYPTGETVVKPHSAAQRPSRLIIAAGFAALAALALAARRRRRLTLRAS